jgi:hypothetical protein
MQIYQNTVIRKQENILCLRISISLIYNSGNYTVVLMCKPCQKQCVINTYFVKSSGDGSKCERVFGFILLSESIPRKRKGLVRMREKL